MATIKHEQDDTSRMLPEYALIGRGPSCDIRLEGAQVSSEHAVIRHTENSWCLVDLGSRNGTWVNGRQLDAGESATLEPGMSISFGSPSETWVVSSSAPPEPFVRGGGHDLPIVDGLIALPSDEELALTIWRAGDGEWFVEHEGGREQVENRDRIKVAGRWRVYLPADSRVKTEVESGRIADATLTVRHDPTEELICAELTPRFGPLVDLGERAHHVVLLELARARLDDLKQGLDEAQAGWLHRDELAQRTALAINHVNIMIFRIRKQLASADLLDAANIVERQQRLGLMRLGVRDVRVIRM